MVAVKMIEKCGLQDIDTLSLTSKSCQSLNCLEELYVERSFSLFKDPQVALWFKRGVTSTQVLLKTSQSFKKLSNKAFVTRTTKYPKEIPFNILRHLFLSEYAGMNGFIPGHLGSQLLVNHTKLPHFIHLS